MGNATPVNKDIQALITDIAVLK